MGTRNIIKINEAPCNGCDNCIIACVEGARRLAEGKAVVICDKFCDGLGACIGCCPEGSLSIEKREADEFTEMISQKDQNEMPSLNYVLPVSCQQEMKRPWCSFAD